MKTVLTKDINACAKALLEGRLVAFGTDTVYGIGAVYNNEQAVKSIYTLKGRAKEKPLNLLVSSIKMAKDHTLWNEDAQSLAEAFWGGALTLILPKREGVPDFVTAGRNTVGVRMPALKEAAELIDLCGKPLAVPSANPSGKPSATEAAHVLNYFNGKLPLILDTGKCKGGLESTVYDVLNREILRIGCISKEQIEQTINGEVKLLKQEIKPQYKPSYKLILVNGNKKAEKIKELCNYYGKDGRKYVILDIDGALTDVMQNTVNFNGDRERLAASLYSTLLFYEGKTDVLIVLGTEDKGVGGVITDRLERAAEEIIET